MGDVTPKGHLWRGRMERPIGHGDGEKDSWQREGRACSQVYNGALRPPSDTCHRKVNPVGKITGPKSARD